MYGTAIPVHARDPSKFQHQGFGMLLMEEAARIAREEHGSTKISVISGTRCRARCPPQGWCRSWLRAQQARGRCACSNDTCGFPVRGGRVTCTAGVGTRHYYRKLGYEIDGPYMSKAL